MKQFEVCITKNLFATAVFVVSADSDEDAANKALRMAYNTDFEYAEYSPDAQYYVNSIRQCGKDNCENGCN